MNIKTSLNMNGNELQNAVIQPLSTEPSKPKEGQIYYDNKTKSTLQYNGTSWVSLGAKQRPPDIAIELDPVWQNRYGGTFCNVEQNGRVTVTIGAGTVSQEGVTGTSLVGKLPEEYRPRKTFYFPCVSSYQAITGYITENGTIGILTQNPITVVYGQFSFYM